MHRPADSRLLSNLVTHEKDYAKSLKSLQAPSHALSAYAAACAPPLSNALLHVSAALGGADEALARYADAVEECKEHLARIKELEDDLSVVVRDREILITRLIKASKSVKTSRRDSVHRSSASTHSLSSGMSSPSSTHVHSIHVPASSKLGAAQAELQACEATLAQNGHYVRQTPDAPPAPKRLPHAAEPFYIPPAHAISDSHPFLSQQRVLPRRITEESIRRPLSVSDGGSSIDEPVAPVHAVDNPRYAAVGSKTPERSPRKAGLLVRRGSNASASEGRLFGSLKGLFGGSSPRSGESSPAPDDKRRREAESGRRGHAGRGSACAWQVEKDEVCGSANVPPSFAGTEIEKRHLASVFPRRQDDRSSDRRTERRASVSGSGTRVDRKTSTRSAASAPGARPRVSAARKMPTRPAVSPLRSAPRNTPLPMPVQADSDSSDDVFYEADDGLGAEVPQRKSVRVSLQPSFRSARDVWEGLERRGPR
ncbi:hypothetical protein C0992_008181, partial [Termitomyces sp. T32_za158]